MAFQIGSGSHPAWAIRLHKDLRDSQIPWRARISSCR